MVNKKNGDGAISDKYWSAPVRVLHLLKQVNSDETGWTLQQLLQGRQMVNHETREVTNSLWKNVARWSHLLQTDGQPQFNSLVNEELYSALFSSAVVNLMNEPGSASTASGDLLIKAEEAKDIWQAQIVDLQPDFVVCGGTFWVLEKLGACPGKPEVSPSGMRYCKDSRGCVYFDFVHPAYRISHAMMYAWLRATVLALRP